MKIRRSFRLRVTLIALVALLFAQLSVAAYACPSATRGADAEMPVDCAGMTSEADPASPNLCAEHCHYGQQSDQPRSPAMPAVVLISLYEVSLPLGFAAPVSPAADASGLLAARPPPHAILHCCFRI